MKPGMANQMNTQRQPWVDAMPMTMAGTMIGANWVEAM